MHGNMSDNSFMGTSVWLAQIWITIVASIVAVPIALVCHFFGLTVGTESWYVPETYEVAQAATRYLHVGYPTPFTEVKVLDSNLAAPHYLVTDTMDGWQVDLTFNHPYADDWAARCHWRLTEARARPNGFDEDGAMLPTYAGDPKHYTINHWSKKEPDKPANVPAAPATKVPTDRLLRLQARLRSEGEKLTELQQSGASKQAIDAQREVCRKLFHEVNLAEQ